MIGCFGTFGPQQNSSTARLSAALALEARFARSLANSSCAVGACRCSPQVVPWFEAPLCALPQAVPVCFQGLSVSRWRWSWPLLHLLTIASSCFRKKQEVLNTCARIVSRASATMCRPDRLPRSYSLRRFGATTKNRSRRTEAPPSPLVLPRLRHPPPNQHGQGRTSSKDRRSQPRDLPATVGRSSPFTDTTVSPCAQTGTLPSPVW